MEEIIEKTINKSKTIGIGSGKTISNLIPYLPKDRIYIPSSYQTNYLLSENNLETSTLETTENLDLYYDSADFYDEDENLLKGGGGCLTTEKIMLGMCNKSAIVVHKNKFVQTFNK